MALETAPYIAGLNANNPAPGDAKSQGDDHLRLIKAALLECFGGFAGAVLLGGADAGAADAYILTPATPLLAYTENMMVVFKPSAVNTTRTPTINISGLGAQTIQAIDGTQVIAGDLPAGRYVALVYNGTAFQLAAVSKNYVDKLAFNTTFPAAPNDGFKYQLISQNGATGWQRLLTIFSDPVALAQVQATALCF